MSRIVTLTSEESKRSPTTTSATTFTSTATSTSTFTTSSSSSSSSSSSNSNSSGSDGNGSNSKEVPVYSVVVRMVSEEDKKAKEKFISQTEEQIWVLLAENGIHGGGAEAQAQAAIEYIRQQLDLCPRSFFRGRGRLILKHGDKKREIGPFSMITLELNLVTREVIRPTKWTAAMKTVGEKINIIIETTGDMIKALGSLVPDIFKSLCIWLLRILVKIIRYLDPILQKYLGFSIAKAFWGVVRYAAVAAGFDETVIPETMPNTGPEIIYSIVEAFVESKWNNLIDTLKEDWKKMIARAKSAGESFQKFVGRIAELIGEVAAGDNDFVPLAAM